MRRWREERGGAAPSEAHAGRRERKERFRRANPAANAAHRVVETAIASGALQRSPCCACGAEKTEAHHYLGYEYPLDVAWLCRGCHRMAHSGRLHIAGLMPGARERMREAERRRQIERAAERGEKPWRDVLRERIAARSGMTSDGR